MLLNEENILWLLYFSVTKVGLLVRPLALMKTRIDKRRAFRVGFDSAKVEWNALLQLPMLPVLPFPFPFPYINIVEFDCLPEQVSAVVAVVAVDGPI